MKKLFLSVAVLCVTLFVQAKDYADYVSPLVGTTNQKYRYRCEYVYV